MHLNSFNKLVKYLLEANEGVFRYSDLTGEPVAEPVPRFFRDRGKRISQQEYEQAMKKGESGIGKSGTRTSIANKRIFSKDSYIKQLENTLSKHLKHKMVIFLNDLDDPEDYWPSSSPVRPESEVWDEHIPNKESHEHIPSQKSHVTVDVPADIIGIELSMIDPNSPDDVDTLAILTPWMVGHRMGHQIFYPDSPYKIQVRDILKRLLRKNELDFVYGMTTDYSPGFSDNIIPYEIAVKMFNFKSIKESKSFGRDRYLLYASEDFYNEIFAQYVKYGKVTIHYPGTPQERQHAARQIEQIFSSWLDTLKGKVINIDG